MKKLLTFLVVMFVMAGSTVRAQEVNSIATLSGASSVEDVTMENVVDCGPRISLDTRFGYEHQSSGRMGGFGGDGFLLNVDGKIGKRFSYSLCHSLVSPAGDDSNIFDATRWLTLSYDLGNFTFTAGKEALMVGSFEYDAYELDCYYEMGSMFKYNINCWLWGASAMWTNNAETSSFAFQVANSPFAFAPKEDNLYAYSMAWYGMWEKYESIWSVNMMEYESGKFVKMLALGNMFYLGDFELMFDYITRAKDFSKGLGKDYTITLQPAYNFGESLRLFGRFGVEKTDDDVPYDFLGEYLPVEDKVLANEENEYVMPAYIANGKEYIYYGAGLEYFPLKEDKSVRLHAVWASNNYTKRHMINVGLTWKFDVLGAMKFLAGEAK